jgi:hypothetical protein
MSLTSEHVPCAVIHAGPETMLAVLAREGRFPIQVLSTANLVIAWSCADGALEHVVLEGSQAQSDHAILLRDLSRDGVLLAEVSDLQEPNNPDANFHLVELKPEDSVREQVQ